MSTLVKALRFHGRFGHETEEQMRKRKCEEREQAAARIEELESARAALHPEQVADLAARCGVKGSASALAEFAALVREAEPLAPDEMRPAVVAEPVAEVTQGPWPAEPTPEMQHAGASAIRFDTTIINKLWTANAVYRAMRAVAVGLPPAASIIGYVEPGHAEELRKNQREGCYMKVYAVPFSEASGRPTVPLYGSAVDTDSILQAAQRRAWAALDRRACPGVWMQIASDAIFDFKTDSYGTPINPTNKPE